MCRLGPCQQNRWATWPFLSCINYSIAPSCSRLRAQAGKYPHAPPRACFAQRRVGLFCGGREAHEPTPLTAHFCPLSSGLCYPSCALGRPLFFLRGQAFLHTILGRAGKSPRTALRIVHFLLLATVPTRHKSPVSAGVSGCPQSLCSAYSVPRRCELRR